MPTCSTDLMRMTWAVVSAVTNISGPRERIRTWRESALAISAVEMRPSFHCSLTQVWSCVICLALPLRMR